MLLGIFSTITHCKYVLSKKIKIDIFSKLNLSAENYSYYLLKITKKKLSSIILFLALPSQKVPTSTYKFPSIVTPDSFQAWLFSTVFYCHYRVSLICLIYFSLMYFLDIFFDIFLAKSIFYTIKSITMFLKVINKVIYRALTQT